MNSEFNWSGRKPGLGQHVEFEAHEEIPLTEYGLLGESGTARVEKVQCRRIFLARKSMRCFRPLKLSEALNEVEHLQRLRHCHIVQLVGTYLQGKTFSMLLFPVADCQLKDFMHRAEKILRSPTGLEYCDFLVVATLGDSMRCLASALEYVHRNTTKHMDIKPKNILVKSNPHDRFGHRVYLADFGTSRAFAPQDHSQTDSVVGMTRIYCAPEVAKFEMWGRAADIFSLGCVFLEMQTVLCCCTIEQLEDFRTGNMDDSMDMSYQQNLPRVLEWCSQLRNKQPRFVIDSEDILKHDIFASRFTGYEFLDHHSLASRHLGVCTVIQVMLDRDPEKRPTAALLSDQIGRNSCCRTGPEPFVAETSTQPCTINESTQMDALFDTETFLPAERNEILVHVVETGDMHLTEKILARMIKAGISLWDVRSSHEQTFIEVAMNNNHVQLIEIVVKLENSFDSLFDLLYSYDRAALRRPFLNFPEGGSLTSFGQDFLQQTKLGIKQLELLLEKGFNAKNAPGHSNLRYAVVSGHVEVVRILLEYGVSTLECGLGLAIAQQNHEIIEVLLTAGANICAEEDLTLTSANADSTAFTVLLDSSTFHYDNSSPDIQYDSCSSATASNPRSRDGHRVDTFVNIQPLQARPRNIVSLAHAIEEMGILWREQRSPLVLAVILCCIRDEADTKTLQCMLYHSVSNLQNVLETINTGGLLARLVRFKRFNEAAMLLEKGADPNAAEVVYDEEYGAALRKGRRALHYAASYAKIPPRPVDGIPAPPCECGVFVDKLIAHGARLDTRDADHRIPLDFLPHEVQGLVGWTKLLDVSNIDE